MSTTQPEVLARRLVRGAVGGLLAGLVFIFITRWFASSVGDPSDGPLMMISTLLKGDGSMAAGTASASLGWGIHFGLSAAFGIVFALMAPFFRTNGTVAIAGVLYGGLLYLVNFKILAPIAFPIFKLANQPFEVVVHIVFGFLLALAFFGTGVRRHDPIIATGKSVGVSR